MIVGTGRSGSTFLANALGSFGNAFSAGELRYLWSRGINEDRYCGCGKRISACPRWRSILSAVPGAASAADIDRTLQPYLRLRRLWRLLRAPGVDAASDSLLRDSLEDLYSAIGAATGAVVIDSSKLPTYVAILTRLNRLDVRLLHVVRDPRAAAWSWRRARPSGAVEGFDEEMDQFSWIKSGTLWTAWNAATAWLWGRRRGSVAYLRVRYEDFAASPRRILGQIAEFAGLEGDPVFPEPSVIDLRPSHAVAGNPNRVRSGPTRIRPDEEWRDAMPAHARLLVGALTWPVRVVTGHSGRGE